MTEVTKTGAIVLTAVTLTGLGFGSLEAIFRNERDEAIAALTNEKTAIERYAQVLLFERLRLELERARPLIDHAREDLLVPDGDLLLVENGQALLPRPRVHAESSRAIALHARIFEDLDALRAETAESPWAERLDLLTGLFLALDRQSAADIERSFRRILAHRTRHVLNSDEELASSIAAIERLVLMSSPDEALLRAFLREGLEDPSGARLVGLQRLLLERRERLSRSDFAALAERIEALSERALVPHDDFSRRVQEPPVPAVAGPFAGRALLDGQFYAETQDGTTRGVRVDGDAMLTTLRDEMAKGGLVRADERLRLERPEDMLKAVSLDDFEITLSSERFAQARTVAARRYHLKLALAASCFGLAFALVAMSLALARRKRRLVEQRSEFVATVSHELRTPLASIRLMAETLERRLDGNAVGRDYPTRIVRETDGLCFLVDNILSFNRLDKGRWPLACEQIRVADWMDEVRDAAAQCAGREVLVDGSPLAEVQIFADPRLMSLVFLNLARNAAQYNEQTPVRIMLSTRAGAGVVIEFTDNGFGIPDAEWRRVFEDFHRSSREEVRRTKGSGLGLAICRRVMHAHGGSIRILRSDEKGTTFELVFPTPRHRA